MVTIQQKENHFLQVLCLYGLRPLAGERTVQSLYYIWRGRKSNQTYQDVHMYKLHSLYRIFPAFPSEYWKEMIACLIRDEFIRMQPWDGRRQKESFILTEKGSDAIKSGEEEYQLESWLTKIAHAPTTASLRIFWQKLHLIVQTCSHLLYGHASFVPVVQERRIQMWVKEQLQGHDMRESWLTGLSEELYQLLLEMPADHQQLLVSQLSGESQVGLTITQCALERGEARSYTQLKMYGLLGQLWGIVAKAGKRSFPLLHTMIDTSTDQSSKERLTQSAQVTFKLLRSGKNVEEISVMRGIKRNTVEDHLVEIALTIDEFDVTLFLTPEDENRILTAKKDLKTNRLRLLKEAVGENISYLQIRLALAREGRLRP